MKKLKTSSNNKKARLNFVDYWADFVRENDDKVWSSQQKVLIDSQIKNAKNFKLSRKEYLEIKKD